jgi:hypothetical protein
MNTSKLLAQGIINPVLKSPIGGTGSDPSGTTGAGKFIAGLVNFFIALAVIGALFYLLLGGLAWVTSDGDKAKLETARNRITHAIIGLVIVAAAWAVTVFVGKFIGIDVTSLPFPVLTQ